MKSNIKKNCQKGNHVFAFDEDEKEYYCIHCNYKKNGNKFGLDPEKFEGYLSEEDEGVWISAIRAKQIGKGHFSELIKELKSKYKWIKIPTPSIMMAERAIHLGFKMRQEWFGEPFNEEGTVLYWEKEK